MDNPITLPSKTVKDLAAQMRRTPDNPFVMRIERILSQIDHEVEVSLVCYDVVRICIDLDTHYLDITVHEANVNVDMYQEHPSGCDTRFVTDDEIPELVKSFLTRTTLEKSP